MKIDITKARKSSLEVPPDCKELIDRLLNCTWSEVLIELKRIETWTYGKCELFHWVKVLDYFDNILESAVMQDGYTQTWRDGIPENWHLKLDNPENEELKELVIWVLHFTTLLIEHSFSRHMYNSVEHLLVLLSSCNLDVVLAVLNLLYMFSKRSNFILRLKPIMRDSLLKYLTYLAESWGGRENGFGLADCCRDNPTYCPPTATTLHYEFYSEENTTGKYNQATCIHLENVDKLNPSPAEIMNSLLGAWKVPIEGQVSLFTHLRLAHAFSNYQLRLKCVQARLQSLSILLYNHSFIEIHNLLYPGLLEELVELLELNDPNLIEIKAAALRTLTSIIHLDRNPRSPVKSGSRMNMIIEVTGAGMYHGFLPQMVRNCIGSLTGATTSQHVPLPLATALFSFLYHLSSYDQGSEALVNCVMMESLLRIVNWPGNELEHITFVTRAVRVIDLITNMDMQAFITHGGMKSFIDRLAMEVKICRREQPFEITLAEAQLDEEMNRINVDSDSSSHSQPSCSNAPPPEPRVQRGRGGTVRTCLTQRAALLKSMLNFMKKALQDATIHDTTRHVMDGTLPSSLKHVISNAEYYGPSLFLLATDVVVNYVFQEPALLTALQENGLTDVVLHALLVKDVPATREVLASLPNVFSALCLNTRGLNTFIRYRPFDKLFKALISPVYLSAMRNRRSVNAGDTATNLGSAMDELMRHQPSLKLEAIKAIIRLLEALCKLGRDPRYVCWRALKGETAVPSAAQLVRVSGGAAGSGGVGAVEAGGGDDSSDEEDDDEEEASNSTHVHVTSRHDVTPHETTNVPNANDRTPIALIDYISNVMKFIDAILSNNSTDDHCVEFMNQGGLVPLLSVLGLPNLPVDYPSTIIASQSVATVCKSIMDSLEVVEFEDDDVYSEQNLLRHSAVMEVALRQLSEILDTLAPLIEPRTSLEGSILLHELANAPNVDEAIITPSATPLLHAISAVNSYVIMLVSVCRTAQVESRNSALINWGSELGEKVLNKLCLLYSSSLWESTTLLALCSDDPINPSRFNYRDIDNLYTDDIIDERNRMEVDEPGFNRMRLLPGRKIPPVIQCKFIKPILGTTSRLGRGLAELFGLLVKLCVGAPLRGVVRRGPQGQVLPNPNSVMESSSRVGQRIVQLLITGISPASLPRAPIPKYNLTYLICSFGFSTPLLFDDKKLPYHFMLERFMRCSGHNCLFKVFLWALAQSSMRWEMAQPSATKSRCPLDDRSELPLVPEGTDEFLDSWFIFVEKLINQKTVLDPAHASGPEPYTYYVLYLKQMQKMTFLAIMKLWGRRVGPVSTGWGFWPRIVESMLTILKIIICGEKVMRDVPSDEKKIGKTDATKAEGPSTEETTEERRRQTDIQQQVNVSDLQQLVDMGFLRDHCYEALILTSTMEHATDYLLNNFFPYSARSSQQPSMDTEDEAYFSSAISLDDQAESCGTSVPNQMIPNWERIKELESADDMQTLIDNFRFNLVETCVGMLEDIPDYAQNDIIYHSSQLIKVNMLRNGEEYTYSVLETLSNIVNVRVTRFLELMNMKDDENLYRMHFAAPDSLHVYSVIALYKLIFQEIKQPCAEIAHSSHMIDNLVKLLCRGTEVLQKYKHMTTPRWMASILQLLDLMEKVSLTTRRKSTMHNVTVDEWKWFDPGSGRWNCYQSQYNRGIDSAYWAGLKLCKFVHNRRNYTMMFRNMMQTNEESGKTRPIMRSFLTAENAHKQKKHEPSIDDVTAPILFLGGPRHLESFDDCFFAHLGNTKPVEGIPERHIQTIMNAAVTLLKCTDNKETIQAALVLCVRFSRDFKFAQFVAENDVVKTLLSLKSATPFIGFETLATILIRHILEEPATLEVAFEKVLRAKTLPNIPPSYKELNFILRECSAAVCRDMPAFKKVSENILRVDLAACARKAADPEEVRFLMKSVQSNTNKRKKKPVSREVDDSTRRTVYDLLNALVVEIEENNPDEPAPPGAPTSPSERAFANLNSVAEHSHQRHMMNHLANIVNGFDVHDHHIHLPMPTSNNIEDFTPMTGRKKNKVPLISKSCILKILSDAVRSYNTIASLITEYSYSGNKNSAVKEDCTAIAYILDNLMIQEEGMTDTERPNLARGLIAAVASCNHSPDAQMTLVNEVKSALNRALTMKENARKHQHVVDLVGIVTIMIENCPPVPLNSTPLSSSMKLSQYSVNNMVRFMMKKNMVIDLARISHTLDLSSPKMSSTINAALKPLETLSRIMSCPPSNQNTNRVKTRQATAEAAAAARDQPGTSTSDSTNAQGEDAVEDTDNTDHDMSMSGPGDEENMDHRSAMRSELEDLIDRVHNELGSDSPMIDDNEDEDANDGNEGNADYDDNSYENGEDNAPRRNRGQQGNSSGEDSDSDPEDSDDRVDRRMDINDHHHHHDDEPARPGEDEIDGDDDEQEEEEEEEEVEDEEEEEEEEEEEDDEEDEDDDGDHYDNETFEMFDTEDGILHIPGLDHESDDFLMIEFSEPIDHSTPLMPWTSPAFSFPSSLLDEATHENSNGRMPPFHPFLMTRPNLLGADGHHRGQRGMTSRIRRHPMDNHPAERLPYIGAPVPHHGHGHGLLHGHGHGLIHHGHHGHNADIVTATLSNNTRVVVMDNGLGIFTNTEEEQISYVDQSGYLSGPSLAATLNNVPTSMHWWNEESKLLDGDSEADAATVVGYDITNVVLKYRAEDMAKCQENIKKYVEQKRKRRGEPEKKASSSTSHNDHSSVSSMDIFEPSSAGPVAETGRPSASASASSGSAGPSRIIDHAQLARNREAITCLAAAARFVSERSADNIVHSAIRTWPRPNDQPLPQPPSSAEQPYGSYEALVTFAPSFDEDLPSVEIRTDGARDDDEFSMPSVHSYQPSPIDFSDPPDDPPSQPSSQANNDPLQPTPSTQHSSQSSVDSQATVLLPPHNRPVIRCDRRRVVQPSSIRNSSFNQEPLPQASTSANNQANNQANNPPAEDPFAVYSLDSDPEDTPSESDGLFRVNPFSQNEGTSSQRARMSSWLDNQVNAPNSSSQESQELSSGGCTQQQLASQAATSSQLTDIPEGVDPSFLEALPEDMRAEVIQEHLRLQRMSARSSNGAGEASTSGAASLANLEVNADFLNALPPNIQAEVLAQQRLEQQRQAAAAANPNEPMDPAAFFEDMETDLRVAILTDMEDSQVAVLPPELAAEAQNLRREAESRNRQMHGRFVTHVTGTNGLSSILRAAGPRGPRGGGPRYTIQSLRGHQQHWSAWALRQHAIQRTQPIKPTARTRGRQILDYESICCLLVLLFIDDTKLNTVRLHRVFRNLCYHAPTRDWIIRSLLSIMEKSNEGAETAEKPIMAATAASNAASSSSSSSNRQSKRIAARNGNSNDTQPTATQQPQPTPQSSQSVIAANALAWTRMESASTWLNISMDAALGCRATVFHVNKIPGRRTGTITINHQAAPFVYRHCLDLLISLAKTFPVSFVPKVQASTTNSSSNDANKKKDGTTFWEILVRLDASFNSKKGKSTPKNMQIRQQIEHTSLDTAPFGQLLRMLASPVVKKSSLLLNKLLRLLAVVSSALQVYKEPEQIPRDGGILSNDTLRHLSLVADVLTSISCTEEGIQDATALLLHMSVRLKPIREPIQNMLLDSCNSLAQKMNEEIKTLMKEVIAYRKANKAENDEKNDDTKTVGKGILSNRFTKDTVVVSAPKRVKTGLDLQLSAMGPLISKTSSQASMLRLLKVIVQIRSSTRAFETRNGNKDNDEENDEDEEEEEEDDEELFLQEEARNNDRQATSEEDGQGAGRERRRNTPTPLSQLLKLDDLWTSLSDCLCQLDKTQDTHACLVLQPAVEAFFIVHASSAEAAAPSKGSEQGSSQGSSQATSSQGGAGPSSELAAPPPLSPLPTDGLESEPSSQAETTQSKFLKFAETHRTVLNQILRQSSTPLVDGPFSVLVNHTRMLDFDVKRRYFRSELERVDEAVRREELALHVKRASIFEDSFRELHRRPPEDWKNRFYIVFEGEEGQDAGGLLREWYMIISREIFNPDYALFTTSEGDKVTYTINTSSHYNPNHLLYFKFVGRVIAKAIYDNKLLECYFTRSFYKHILGIPVKYTDMESEDYTFYKSLAYLKKNHISSIGYDLTFSAEVQEVGVTEVRELKPDGQNIPVTEDNKLEYIHLVCQMKMTGAIRKQLDAFLEGFYDIIPNRLISIFNEQELELLISGLPNVDIDDLKANTEYYKYQPSSLQIQWFWRALREFNQAERAKFLQFVTGTSKVPLQGFSALEGMNGVQKFQIHRDERSTDRLPSAHTCFNQLDLPVYEDSQKLRNNLLKAIHECSEGFGFA